MSKTNELGSGTAGAAGVTVTVPLKTVLPEVPVLSA